MSFLINIAKKIVLKLFDLLPLRNIILFESTPCFSDNTIMVYNELVKRGIDKKYKLIWVVTEDVNTSQYNYVNTKTQHKKYMYYCHTAKLMISGNDFIEKKRNKQYYLHLSHGAALKNCSGFYHLPKFVNNAVSYSDYLAKYDAINYQCDMSKMVNLGYPRNDLLFEDKVDLHKYFNGREFDKAIYWMPTYRQHNCGDTYSDISMPIIYNEEIANQINDFARDRNVLVIIKPHPAQDVSKITAMNLSNLVFIDNSFLADKSINNYILLGSCDAMLSDYSSVYYDYLLTDKPIGLCFDDFDTYNKTVGFTVDPDFILAGGEKLYNADDLNAFIDRISKDEDALCKQRREIRDLVHKHSDNQSTKRVADFIESKLKEL